MNSIIEMINYLETTVLQNFVAFCTFLLEMAGIIVLVYTSIKSFIHWVKKKDNVHFELAQGTLLALTFKMGGEVLRTVVVRNWQELGILGAVIFLRAALTMMLRWEIKNAEKDIKFEKENKII